MKIQVDFAKKRESGTSRPTSRLHLNWAWPGIVADGIVMVFVKQVVMSIAEVLCTTPTELCCVLSAARLSLHPFLGCNSEATDISHFDLFTGLEIGARVLYGN